MSLRTPGAGQGADKSAVTPCIPAVLIASDTSAPVDIGVKHQKLNVSDVSDRPPPRVTMNTDPLCAWRLPSIARTQRR
jgi:hypothetical protein